MSLSPFETLPPETLWAITNELRDEPPVLAKFALTCSDLLPFARAALYDNVELRAGDDTEEAVHRSQKRFADAVLGNPILGPLVRNLSICMRTMTFDRLPPSLHSVLSQGAFTRLESLAIIEVNFLQVDELFAILQANRGLQTLLLSHTSIRNAGNLTDAQINALSRNVRDALETLVVRWPKYGWEQDIERMFGSMLDLTRLQVIELALRWPDQQKTWLPAIRAASSSIVTLRFTSGPQDGDISPTKENIKLLPELLSIPLPSLRSLQLAYFSTGSDLCTYFMETVCTVLQTHPSPFPKLTELELILTDRPDPATVRQLAHQAQRLEGRSVTPKLTSSLAQALFGASPQRHYPHLQRVRVRIRQQVYYSPSRSRVRVTGDAPLWRFITLDKALAKRSSAHVLLWKSRGQAASECARVLATWKTLWEPFAIQAIENGVKFDMDLLWDDPYNGSVAV